MSNRIGTITLTGASKKTYEFTIYKREQEFLAVGAVYVMSKLTTELRYRIIYVGQTSDLSERPLNHHKTDCFDEHGADHLLIHSEANEKKRLEIEADLIAAYNPPCNG
ncbi:MAG TPA: hypothetical protein VFB31_01550 [Pseudolabrys sp.]|nr:hypothetical protein [Pseudolabrys sp.]